MRLNERQKDHLLKIKNHMFLLGLDLRNIPMLHSNVVMRINLRTSLARTPLGHVRQTLRQSVWGETDRRGRRST